MELRHLRYFVAVAEELHFRRAAERLHVAQPAVSEQVRKLEEELGVRLLNRTQRSVSLTNAGAVFLREARRVLEQAEAARLAARNARDRVTSSLRIGYMPASLPASVPRTLQRLAMSMPQLETTLEHGSGAELIEAVRAERLDAAIVALPAPTAGLRKTALGEQRALAALPVMHDHAVKPEIRLEQVAPDRIVVLPREANRPFYDAVVASCHDAGLCHPRCPLPAVGRRRTGLRNGGRDAPRHRAQANGRVPARRSASAHGHGFRESGRRGRLSTSTEGDPDERINRQATGGRSGRRVCD